MVRCVFITIVLRYPDFVRFLYDKVLWITDFFEYTIFNILLQLYSYQK